MAGEDVSYEIDERLLRDLCPTYSEVVADQQLPPSSRSELELGRRDAEILQLRDNYRLKVESGNNYVEKLLDIEKDYFESKYGEKIYDYLKSKRDEYINQQESRKCDAYFDQLSASESGYAPASVPSLDTNFVSSMMTDISQGIQFYKASENVDTSDILNKYKNATSYLKSEMDEVYSKSSTTTRKIEYRNEEVMNVNYINNLLTILYYVVVLVYIVVALASNSLELSKNFILYTFVILFPIYIYPLIFRLIQILYNYLTTQMDHRGPKSAFINESKGMKKNLNFVDDFDV